MPAARRATWVAVSLVALAGCARAPRVPTGITTGDGVLRAMRERYDGRWYRTLTFAQRTTQAPPGGGAARRSVSFDALAVPGRLRIETDSSGRSGRLLARDSQFVVVNGQLRRGVPGHNVRLVLAFDVYAQTPARTAEILRGLGFPAGPVREDTWEGRAAYVVGGTGPNDLRSHQYWVDKERLVVVRLIQPAPGAAGQTFEVRFNKYRPLGEAWIASEVEELVDGTRALLDEFEDVRVNPPLDDALFDPRSWSAAGARPRG